MVGRAGRPPGSLLALLLAADEIGDVIRRDAVPVVVDVDLPERLDRLPRPDGNGDGLGGAGAMRWSTVPCLAGTGAAAPFDHCHEAAHDRPRFSDSALRDGPWPAPALSSRASPAMAFGVGARWAVLGERDPGLSGQGGEELLR